MTAELISAAAPSQAEPARQLFRPVVGVLADGTPFYAPIGEVVLADARVTVAAGAAARFGFADIGSLVTARSAAGMSLAAVSREIGLHKDWLSRHLHRLDPVAASQVMQRPRRQPDAAWAEVLTSLGFTDVAAYLHDRHLVRHQTGNVIAAEIGMSHHAIEAALRRHGLTRMPHAAKRHAASQRAAVTAARLGYPSIASYVSDRRARGWTWSAIAAESGQPQTWLRRNAFARQEARGRTGAGSPWVST